MVGRYELFSFTISSIHSSIQKIETEEMIRYGLKGAFAQYLTVLSRYKDGLTLSRLSEECMKDKAAVSRAISEMERKKLVCRSNDSGSFYRARLCLTPDGQRAASYVRSRAVAAVELAGKGLSDEDRKIFYSVLELISENLRNICSQGFSDKEHNTVIATND